MSRFSLLFGDCLDLMPTLPAASVDMVLCDLPFGTTSCAWDIVISFAKLWPNYKRLLKPGGAVVLFGSQPFTSLMVASNLKWFKYELIGDKNKCGSPGLAKIRPMKTHENIIVFGDDCGCDEPQHENICVFAPGRTVYNPQMEPGKPYSRQSKRPEGYVGKHNRHGYGMKPRAEFANTGTRYPKSIINMRRDFSAQQQVHGAQKPVHTCEWLILTYSGEDAVVLDNSMGSGTTGVACARTGRKFIGMDNDAESFGIAEQRVEEAYAPASEPIGHGLRGPENLPAVQQVEVPGQ